MVAPGDAPQTRHWARVTAAIDAAVRELPTRLMYVDPRIAGAEATRGGLVLAGNWAAPARAREATSRACTAAGLPPAVGATASVLVLRAVSSAVARGATSLLVTVEAGAEGVYVSLRAQGVELTSLLEVTRRGGGPARSGVGRTTPRPGPAGRLGHGAQVLLGVVVSAWGLVDDRSDTVVWFEVRR